MSDWSDIRGWWAAPLPYRPLWIAPGDGLFCVLDEIDWHWASQWLWAPKPSRSRHLLYAYRNTRLAGLKGPQTTVYLHKEIMRRAVPEPPDEFHLVADHINGNTLDNRRANLRWATLSMNAINRPAYRAQQELPL